MDRGPVAEVTEASGKKLICRIRLLPAPGTKNCPISPHGPAMNSYGCAAPEIGLATNIVSTVPTPPGVHDQRDGQAGNHTIDNERRETPGHADDQREGSSGEARTIGVVCRQRHDVGDRWRRA